LRLPQPLVLVWFRQAQTNWFDFQFQAGNQDEVVCLKTLSFSSAQQTLGIPVPVNQLAPQAISGRTTLTEPQFDEAALP
jgi:hypothetical protein